MLFLIVSVLILNSIAFLIPKQLTKVEIYHTCLFAFVFGVIVDVFLSFKYNLYGYFTKGVDWMAMIPILGLYPAVNVIFLNLFPFKKKKRIQFFYILGWSIFAVLFELGMLRSGTFYYNGWKIWYSAVLYPILYLILVGNLMLIRKMARS